MLSEPLPDPFPDDVGLPNFFGKGIHMGRGKGE